jgi:hypothetical protein
MNARQVGTHRRRINKTMWASLDMRPEAARLLWRVSIDGEEIATIEAPASCAEILREDGYTVELTAPTAEQRLAAIVELCQRVDANGGGGYVRTDAILALALGA